MSATQVWERLFTGGIGDAEALSDFNPVGITTVVNLCRETVGKSNPLMGQHACRRLQGDRRRPGGHREAAEDCP